MLSHWYDDNSSNSNFYAIYTTDNVKNKVNYTPCYFEDGKRFSDLGPVVIIIFNKNIFNEATNFYQAYLYSSNNDPWWINTMDIDYSNINYYNYRNIYFSNNDNNISYYV
jgi:hypothetical protein